MLPARKKGTFITVIIRTFASRKVTRAPVSFSLYIAGDLFHLKASKHPVQRNKSAEQ